MKNKIYKQRFLSVKKEEKVIFWSRCYRIEKMLT